MRALALFLTLLVSAAVAQDARLTPGVARHDLTQKQVCTTKWGKDQRHVTAEMKRQVFESYGIACKPLTAKRGPACGGWEIDHSISRELGGADDVANLWPQPYAGAWNARMKDRLENRLHKEVCAGHLTLGAAQERIRSDWRGTYVEYFGAPQ